MAPDLFLFTVDPALARLALAAGISAFVIDWEDRRASTERVAGEEATPPDGVADLERMARFSDARRLCRVNRIGADSGREIHLAIDSGATHILLPMVETAREVDRLLTLVAGRAKAGIMIETVAACDNARELARTPIDFVYVGLLDLAICRREGNVFRPLADGTVARLRDLFADVRFGVGGLTVVDGGTPVPCLALMAELVRLRSQFTFLRRSFKRDIRDRDMVAECRRISECWRAFAARSPSQSNADHRQFVERYGASATRA